MEDARQRPAIALADHDYDPTLAGAMLPQPAIAAVLAPIGRLHVTSEIAAIDLCPLALAANRRLPNLGCHRFAHLVSQPEAVM
jgi:hypothetical protein